MMRSRACALRWVASAVAAALVAAARPVTAQPRAPIPVRPLSHTSFVLRNGLVAILNEDHASPLVAVDVWYHLGSKDDPPGRAGIAHLCEHLMSQGSPHLAQPQPAFYRSIGGSSGRAETKEDVTEYYVVVPSNQLETVLWAESDRMAAPLSLADSQHLAQVRPIVAQERQQNFENAPFGVWRELTLAALFPEGHPYHTNSTPGATGLPDLTADQLRSMCGPYYVPNNAVIALSGDFDTATARRWIEHYFGDIPRGKSVAHAAIPRPAARPERRIVLEDARALQPQLHLDWVGASYANPDRMALLALASALSHEQSGRLTKLLIQDRQLASRVRVGNYDLEQSGLFEIAIFPHSGASMTLIEALVDSTLASLATTPITREEVARFNAANAVLAATSLQTRFARADTLAHDMIFAGEPTAYATQAARAQRLLPRDVLVVARKYLTPSRVVMSLVPAGKLDLVSRPDLPYTNVTPRGGGPKP
ncbi:MAG TPA: pitrilysin family protein [Gemmatimonadaceae bacterium]|nr:pitrilysin family protein [Gemmatimonadaceae bacterium]